MQRSDEAMQNQSAPAPATQPRTARPAGASQGPGSSPIFKSLRPVVNAHPLGPSTLPGLSLPAQGHGSQRGSSNDGWYRPPPPPPPAPTLANYLSGATQNYAANHPPPAYSGGGTVPQYQSPYNPYAKVGPSQQQQQPWVAYPPRGVCRYGGYYAHYQEHCRMPSGGSQLPAYHNGYSTTIWPAYAPRQQTQPYYPSPGDVAEPYFSGPPQQPPAQNWSSPQTQPQHATSYDLVHQQVLAQHGAVQNVSGPQTHEQHSGSEDLPAPPAYVQQDNTPCPSIQPIHVEQDISERFPVPPSFAEQGAGETVPVEHTHVQHSASECVSTPKTFAERGIPQGPSVHHTPVLQGVSESLSIPKTHTQQDVSESLAVEQQPVQPEGLGINLPGPPPRITTAISRRVNPAAPEFQPAQTRPASTVEEATASIENNPANVSDQNTSSADTVQPVPPIATVEFMDWLDQEDNPLKEPWMYDAAYRHDVLGHESLLPPDTMSSDNQRMSTDKINDEPISGTARSRSFNPAEGQNKSTRPNHLFSVNRPAPPTATFAAPNLPPPFSGGRPSNRDSAFADWARDQVTSYLLTVLRGVEQNSQLQTDLRALLSDPNGLLSDTFWEQAANQPHTIGNLPFQLCGPRFVAPIAYIPVPAPPKPPDLDYLVRSQPISFIEPQDDVLAIAGSPVRNRDLTDSPFEDVNPGPIPPFMPSNHVDPSSLSSAPMNPTLTQPEAQPTREELLQRKVVDANEWYHSGLDATGFPGLMARGSGTQQQQHSPLPQEQIVCREEMQNLLQLLHTRIKPYTDGYTNFQTVTLSPSPSLAEPEQQQQQQQSTRTTSGRFPPFREPEPDFSTLQRRRRFLNSGANVPYMGPSCTGFRTSTPPPPEPAPAAAAPAPTPAPPAAPRRNRATSRVTRGTIPRYAFERPKSPSPRERRRYLRL